MRRRALSWLLAALAAGCSSVDTPHPAPAERAAAAAAEGSPAAAAQGGRLKPMPVRPFTVKTDCRFKDETGNFGNARVEVEDSQVRALNVVLTMPRRGVCRFELAQLRQTQALPSIELTGARDCRVRMWEQGQQITVAFADCHQMCSPASAHDYVWPLLIDKPTGECD